MRTAERTIELELRTPKQGAWLRLFSGVVTGIFTVVRVLSNRIQTTNLAELDDYQLADIGLVRSDVLEALDVGLMEDPTLHLTRAAQLRARYRFNKVAVD